MKRIVGHRFCTIKLFLRTSGSGKEEHTAHYHLQRRPPNICVTPRGKSVTLTPLPHGYRYLTCSTKTPLINGGGCGAAPPLTMKTVSWNCHGRGNPEAIRAVRQLTKSEAPNLVFLMETKKKSHEIQKSCSLKGFNCVFAVDCVGVGNRRARGLALY